MSVGQKRLFCLYGVVDQEGVLLQHDHKRSKQQRVVAVVVHNAVM
jgi:hypothetical protein